MKPFLKWVGGKRWLPAAYPHCFPISYGRYIEPFVGGGAIFFGLRPQRALLSDANSRLISCYQALKDDWKAVRRHLVEYSQAHSDSFYYRVRGRPQLDEFREAARFIYLNRTCFNGIYRENLKGQFNVPRGSKDAVLLPDDDFEMIATCLQNADLATRDFTVSISAAKRHDFVFVDPPYTVKHNLNGFVKYNQKIFQWDDQIRLRDCVEAAATRGAKIFVTNANHASVRDLYKGIGEIHVLKRRSVIAASSRARGEASEIGIVVGYEAGSPRELPSDVRGSSEPRSVE